MNYGYVRCLPDDMEMKAQTMALEKYAIDEWVREENYRENAALDTLLEKAGAGDTVYVQSLAAFVRSPVQLGHVLEYAAEKGLRVYFHREEIDSEKPLSLTLEQMVRMFTEFQGETKSIATRAGIDEAREKGITTGRPRKKDENVREAIRMYRSNQYTFAEIREKTNISKTTLYRYLAQENCRRPEHGQ
ncbi:recombinase family protein [Edaphobacillus lindanitolerans]|uniref:Site-specific DNA recombinase n=1 Tax=Edaphobacillus lindanitolerans TaxID=550447 RepID=A0A1U7PPV6_9BACI|nr:recombinase family protein [Edaphobacillus lindanitolerans]SIT88361.1 Site-specific DNA recombinase [Edaphobacillus lindanitolerans]